MYGTAAPVEAPRILIAEGLAVLAMEVRAQLPVDPETAAKTLAIKRMGKASVIHLPALRYHVVQPGDCGLS